jgi:NAD+ dependent glucose-6-phosphate dehydrogenase
MADERPIVLMTGAGGNIGSGFRNAYLREYSEHYALRLGMRHPENADERFDDVAHVELEDPKTLREACRGVSAVIHLAANPDWEAEFCDGLVGPNIIGTYNVFEAARDAGCKRVIYASSVHAIMGYPLDFQAHHDDPPRPDTLYGVTKVFGEAMCSSYVYTSNMSCIAIRIGAYVGDDEHERVTDSANPQLLDIVVSERDMAQLLHRCIMAPDDVKYAIFNGLSNNRFKRMDIENARRLLGYDPEDDAFEWSEKVALGPEKKV